MRQRDAPVVSRPANGTETLASTVDLRRITLRHRHTCNGSKMHFDETTRIPTSVTSALTQTGVGFGVGSCSEKGQP